MASVVQVRGQQNPMLTVDQIGQGLQNIRRSAQGTDAIAQQMNQSAQLQPYRVQSAQTQAQYLPLLDQAKIQQANMAARSGGISGLAGQYNYLNYLSQTYGANDPRTLHLKSALDAELKRKQAQTMYYMNPQRFLGKTERTQLDQEFHNLPNRYTTSLQVALEKLGWTPSLLQKYGFSPTNPPPLNQSMQQVIQGRSPIAQLPAQNTVQPQPQGAAATPSMSVAPAQEGQQGQVETPQLTPVASTDTSPSGGAMGGSAPVSPTQTATGGTATTSPQDDLQSAAEALQIASTVDKDNYTKQQLQQINRYKTVTTNLDEMTPLVSDAAKFAGLGGKLNEINDKQLGNLGLSKGTPQYNNLIKFKNLQTTLANELAAATLSPKTDTSLKEWFNFVKSPGATSPEEVVKQYNNLQGIIAAQAQSATTPFHKQIAQLKTFTPTQATLDNAQGGAMGKSMEMPTFSTKADAVKWYNSLSPQQQASLRG